MERLNWRNLFKTSAVLLVLVFAGAALSSVPPVDAAAVPPPTPTPIVTPTAESAAAEADESADAMVDEESVAAEAASFEVDLAAMMSRVAQSFYADLVDQVNSLTEQLGDMKARVEVAEARAEAAELALVAALEDAKSLLVDLTWRPVAASTSQVTMTNGVSTTVFMVDPQDVGVSREVTVSSHVEITQTNLGGQITDTPELVFHVYGNTDGAQRMILSGWVEGIEPDVFDAIPPHEEMWLPLFTPIADCPLEEEAGLYVCRLSLDSYGDRVLRWMLSSELTPSYEVTYVRNDGTVVGEDLIAYDRFNGGKMPTGYLDSALGEFWPTAIGQPLDGWVSNDDGSYSVPFDWGTRFTHYQPSPLVSYEAITLGVEDDASVVLEERGQ